MGTFAGKPAPLTWALLSTPPIPAGQPLPRIVATLLREAAGVDRDGLIPRRSLAATAAATSRPASDTPRVRVLSRAADTSPRTGSVMGDDGDGAASVMDGGGGHGTQAWRQAGTVLASADD